MNRKNLTNKLGLPDAIVEAVANDSYSSGDCDISVTSLIGPPRKVALEIKHREEITEDASDRIWSLMGQSIHTILERANKKGIAERRLSITVEGWKVSGGMDLYEEDGTLNDYKVSSVWSVKDGIKTEHEQQLNVYAEILRQNGISIKSLKVISILRDWSKLAVSREENYPQTQVLVQNVPLWTSEFAREFIRTRVILHQQSRVSLGECTDTERWAKPTVWAVMRTGQKKALRLHKEFQAAETHAATSPDLYVEERPGQNTRCESYCAVSKFCDQFQRLKEINATEKVNKKEPENVF